MVAALVQSVSNPFNISGGTGEATYGTPAVAGDLLICGMAQRDGSLQNLVVPSGFTLGQSTAGNGGRSSAIAYKQAVGGETTLSWTSDGGKQCTWIAEFSGVNCVPVDAQKRAIFGSTDRTNWFVIPDLILTDSGLLVLWGGNDDSTSAVRTPNQLYTTVDAGFLRGNSEAPGLVGFHGIIVTGAGQYACSAHLAAGGPDGLTCVGLAFVEGAPPIPNGGITAVIA